MIHVHKHLELDFKFGHSGFAGKTEDKFCGRNRKPGKFMTQLSFHIKKEQHNLTITLSKESKAHEKERGTEGEGVIGGFGKLCVPLEKSWLCPQ